MSNKDFEICKQEIIEKKENNIFDMSCVFGLIDKYSLTNEELGLLIEIAKGNEDAELYSNAQNKSELEKLYEKYNVTLVRKKRIYKENLVKRDYNLSDAVPYSFKFREFVSNTHSWGNLLYDMVEYFNYLYKFELRKLLNFSVSWSKQDIFSVDKKVNSKQLSNGLFLNCNHTALHSCWLIQDLLEFYDIDTDEVELYVHKSWENEPKEIVKIVEAEFKKSFASFLMTNYSKPYNKAEQIINNIENSMNPKLRDISRTYSNFFLFDDYAVLANYITKFKQSIESNFKIPEKNKIIYNRYLLYLSEYYKKNGY